MILKLQSILMLDEVHQYIKQCDIIGRSSLMSAPSDVFDGSYNRDELSDLVRHRVLSIVQYDDFEKNLDDGYYSLCGSSWTVETTDLAMKRFWPDRLVVPKTKRK